MLAAFLPTSVPIPRPTPIHPSFSSARVLSGPNPFGFRPLVAGLRPAADLTVRMGGGPRTYPGGVSKWQWKRMQAKKAKQLLKARLCRERQLYEMRKRAELKAAVSELERPWEVVESAPKLFSVSADEQLKVLADRFQKPGGFDMWSERDGPQVFRRPDGLPSARFFPKGAVHSVQPYGVVPKSSVTSGEDGLDNEEELKFDDWIARGAGGTSRRSRRPSTRAGRGVGSEILDVEAKDSVEESDQATKNVHSNARDRVSLRHFGNRESNVVEDQRISNKGLAHSKRESISRNRGNSHEIVHGSKNSLPSASGVNSPGTAGNGRMSNRGRHGGSNRRFRDQKISLRPNTDLFSDQGPYRMRNSE